MMYQMPVSTSGSKDERPASHNTRKRPCLTVQVKNERNTAVMENKKIAKKVSEGNGKMKGGMVNDVSTTTKNMNSQIRKKRKEIKPDTHVDSTEYIKKARSDSQHEHKDSELNGSNKLQTKKRFPVRESEGETNNSRRGVKHKNFENSTLKEKSRMKLRKIESHSITSKEHQATVSDHLHKNKTSLSSSTNSDVVSTQKATLKKKSKIADLKLDKKSQKKQSTVVSGNISNQLKAVETQPQSTSLPKKKVSNLKNKEKHVAKQDCHQQKDSKAETVEAVDTSDPMALLMMMEGRTGNPSAPHLPNLSHAQSASTSNAIASVSYGKQDSDEEATTTSDEETEGMSDWEEVHDYHTSDRSQIPDGPVEITLEMPDILKHKKRIVFRGSGHGSQVPEGTSFLMIIMMIFFIQLQITNLCYFVFACGYIIYFYIQAKKTFDWKAYLQRRVKRFKKEVAADMHKVHLMCLLALGLRQNDALNDLTVQAMMLSLLPSEYLTNTKLNVQRKVENLLLWYKRRYSLENISHCSSTRLITAPSLIDAVSLGSFSDARVWILVFISILRTIGLDVRLVLSLQPMRFKAHQGWDEKKGGKKKQHRSSTDQVKEDLEILSPKTKTQKPSSKPKKSKSTPKASKSTPKASSTPKRLVSRRESSMKATLKNKSVFKEYGGGDDADDDDDYNASDSDFSEKSLKKMKETKQKRTTAAHDNDCSSSESEFDESTSILCSPVNVLKDLKILSNRKVLSPSTSDDEAAGGKRHGPLGHDIWLEVYSPDSKKWICFDCFKCQFGKPYSIENSATQPLLYVLGFKNDNSVKDVTARYAKQWLSHTRKNRIDQEWWIGTLLMFDSTPYKDNLIEDDEIKSQLLVQPMPNSIAELKSHPLYVLRRHLLKFEAIYPDTAIPLGYIRKEPVYARECVRTLHSRDNWLKEGRLVRLSETPYKMVKSRPKWNKPKENPDALDLALYGDWQTEHYIPPPAVNGKVPRNEYGNVELFKPWMLPQGTVQVRGQGLQRVAKKLNIDIAAAMVGWDNHSGFSHPLMDGWIVCEEYADTLMAAWLEDQEIQKQREIEKKDKRVYDNWRLLIRGLLIKERLKTKFLQATPVVKKLEKQETFSDEEDACDVQFSWPRNRQDRITEEKSKAIQLKTEKDKNVVEKAHDVKVVKEINCVTRKKRGQKKQIEITVSVCKRQAPAISSSDSCSSTDEFEDTKFVKLKPDKVFTKMNHQKDDDLDFIPAGRSRKRNMLGKEKNKTKTDVGDEDEDDDQKEDQGSSTDENEDTKFVKLKPNKGLTKMNHQKDDDPDFIPAGRSRKRNMLKKIIKQKLM